MLRSWQTLHKLHLQGAHRNLEVMFSVRVPHTAMAWADMVLGGQLEALGPEWTPAPARQQDVWFGPQIFKN